MAKPKIFVSFDFENDRNYKYTLNMWNANSSFEFTCNDKSPSEIQSWNIPTVKGVLSRKINEATHVVVIVGKEANEYPEELKNCGAKRVYSFNHDDIVRAVRGW